MQIPFGDRILYFIRQVRCRVNQLIGSSSESACWRLRVETFGNREKEAQSKGSEKVQRSTRPNFASLSFRVLGSNEEDLPKRGLSLKKNVFSHVARCPEKCLKMAWFYISKIIGDQACSPFPIPLSSGLVLFYSPTYDSCHSSECCTQTALQRQNSGTKLFCSLLRAKKSFSWTPQKTFLPSFQKRRKGFPSYFIDWSCMVHAMN